MNGKKVSKKRRLTQRQIEQIRYEKYLKKVKKVNEGLLLGRICEISRELPKKEALRLLQPYGNQINTVVRRYYNGDRKNFKDFDYSVKKIVDFVIRKNLRNEQLR